MPPEPRKGERRRVRMDYELLKVAVSGAGVVVLGLALRQSFIGPCGELELRAALIAGIVALAGFSGRESIRALILALVRRKVG